MSGPKRTALYDVHVEAGARLVPFAGFEMPVQYRAGVIAEHRHCRAAAALFDVSHMGVVHLTGDGADAALERLVPSSVTGLAEWRQRYTFLTNDEGGIVDDLMVARLPDRLALVLNAARVDVDVAHLRSALGPGVDVVPRPDLSLLALQGPDAATVVTRYDPAAAGMVFMDVATLTIDGTPCTTSRSGYTGEDGFELAVPTERVADVARLLLAEPEVEPAGLGARDTLRLEAGLCLYGNDLDETTTPVEADLAWAVQKRRRDEGGFLGAGVILRQLIAGVDRVRVGIRAHGRRPVRAGASLRTPSGEPAGTVTSGGHGPTVDGPVAMGYVAAGLATTGTDLIADVRGNDVACVVADLPFVPHRYVRQTGTAAS
jgi:glycine cleavage system T protein (aminomethyltransferase)